MEHKVYLMEELGKAVGYARTSTDRQNIETQLTQLRNKGIPAKQIFYDEGVSGSTQAKDRPGFKNLLRYLDNNEIDTIYCFELSRLGRTFLDTLNLVMEFENNGVRVISLSPSEAWSKVEDPLYRQLLISLFGWVAENEKRVLAERIKIGIERAKKEGKHCGRPWKRLDKSEAMKLKEKGLSWAAIARVMNVPQSTMYKYKDMWEEEDRIERINKIPDSTDCGNV